MTNDNPKVKLDIVSHRLKMERKERVQEEGEKRKREMKKAHSVRGKKSENKRNLNQVRKGR